MKLFCAGVLVGVIIATVGLASGRSTFASDRSTSKPGPECHQEPYTKNHRTCTLRRGYQYDVEVPSLDLECWQTPAPPAFVGVPTSFSCHRASRPPILRCTEGLVGSLTAWITPYRMYLSFPDQCIPDKSKPKGYVVTKRGGYTKDYLRTP
jgi:hypothetical protein